MAEVVDSTTTITSTTTAQYSTASSSRLPLHEASGIPLLDKSLPGAASIQSRGVQQQQHSQPQPPFHVSTPTIAHPQIPSSLTQSRRRGKSVSRTSLPGNGVNEAILTGLGITFNSSTNRVVPSTFSTYSNVPSSSNAPTSSIVSERKQSPTSGTKHRRLPSSSEMLTQRVTQQNTATPLSSHGDRQRRLIQENMSLSESSGVTQSNIIDAASTDVSSQSASHLPDVSNNFGETLERLGSHQNNPPNPTSSTVSNISPSRRTSPATTALSSPKPSCSEIAAKAMQDDLEKELTCSICTSIYLHPVVLMDCLHSYCGACAKEWFVPPPPTSLSSTTPTIRGCPTCRQAVKSIKPSTQLNAFLEIFLSANPQLRRDEAEVQELEGIYRPGDEIHVARDVSVRDRRTRGDASRRAGAGWWDGLLDEMDSENDAMQAAVRASLLEHPFGLGRSNTRDIQMNGSPWQSNYGRYRPISWDNISLMSPPDFVDQDPHRSMTGIQMLSQERQQRSVLTTLPNHGESATFSWSSTITPPHLRNATGFVQQPAQRRPLEVNCDVCHKTSIHYNLHYHCKICRNNDFDICSSCVRQGNRCQASEHEHHELEARKYTRGTNELELGHFCQVEYCETNCNDMFWHCKICNDGWNYCPTCVGKGDCCSHDLEGMSCSPEIVAELGVGGGLIGESSDIVNPPVLVQPQNARSFAPIATPTTLTSPKPLKLTTRCNMCFQPINTSVPHQHCTICNHGDWDCHLECHALMRSPAALSQTCSHAKQLIVQLPLPNEQNPSTYIRRTLAQAYKPLATRSYTYRTSQGTTTTVEPVGGEDGPSQRAEAKWAYWPDRTRLDAKDELGFPRGAIIEDVLVVNREWMWGFYGNKHGLFPSGWVTLMYVIPGSRLTD